MLRFVLFCGLCLALVAPATAGPPSYLLLRKAEGPALQTGPTGPPIYRHELCTEGYAYGWFGAQPRVHATRHFGFNRIYTEWSFK